MKKSHNRKKTPGRIVFGRTLRKRRLDLELTQEEAAERASLHPTYWGSTEHGERNVFLENILMMAKAFGMLSSRSNAISMI